MALCNADPTYCFKTSLLSCSSFGRFGRVLHCLKGNDASESCRDNHRAQTMPGKWQRMVALVHKVRTTILSSDIMCARCYCVCFAPFIVRGSFITARACDSLSQLSTNMRFGLRHA